MAAGEDKIVFRSGFGELRKAFAYCAFIGIGLFFTFIVSSLPLRFAVVSTFLLFLLCFALSSVLVAAGRHRVDAFADSFEIRLHSFPHFVTEKFAYKDFACAVRDGRCATFTLGRPFFLWCNAPVVSVFLAGLVALAVLAAFGQFRIESALERASHSLTEHGWPPLSPTFLLFLFAFSTICVNITMKEFYSSYQVLADDEQFIVQWHVNPSRFPIWRSFASVKSVSQDLIRGIRIVFDDGEKLSLFPFLENGQGSFYEFLRARMRK